MTTYKVYNGLRIILNVPYKQKTVLLEHMHRLGLLINKTSLNMYDLMSNETLVKHTFKGVDEELSLYNLLKRRTSPSNRGSVAQKHMNTLAPIHLYAEQLGYKSSRIERMAYGMATKFYVGMDKRNGDYKNEFYEASSAPVTKNNRAIHYIDGMARFSNFRHGNTIDFGQKQRNKLVKVNDVSVKIKTHVGEIEFEFFVQNRQKELLQEFLTAKTSGSSPTNPAIEGNLVANLKYKKDGTIDEYRTTFHFVVLATTEQTYAYVPETTLGFDLNQRKDVFVVFSDDDLPNINVRNQTSFNKLIDERKEVVRKIENSKLNKTSADYVSINSRQRRKLRIKWHKLDTKIHDELTKQGYAQLVIEYAKHRKALLAIDDVTFGNHTGWGHSQLKLQIINECIKQGIPYVLVNTAFTSQICYHCLETENKICRTGRSSDAERVSCNNCHQVFDADKTAAKVIAHIGLQEWSGKKFKRPDWNNARKLRFVQYELDNDYNF